jgi:acetyl-CoA acetyltransferase
VQDVAIVGAGMHPFGRFPVGYRELGQSAAREALADAEMRIDEMDAVLVGNVGAEMAKGQNIVDALGRTGVPIINVEAACASSAATLFLGAEMIESGRARAVLCLGVEKAPRGFIAGAGFDEWQTASGIGITPIYFALQAQELMVRAGVTEEDLADVSVKNHAHAVNNDRAMYREAMTREQVLGSRMVCPPLRLLMLCAPNEGAAAVVLMRRSDAVAAGKDAARLLATALVSRRADDWFVPAPSMRAEGRTSLTRRAAQQAFDQAGISPSDLDFVECQDTDAGSELAAYSDLMLCAEGDEAKLLRSGDTWLGGRIPVNPSGGLLSKGEPLGASGLGQVFELVTQLRGRAGTRQVENARLGLSHVMGAGHNAAVVIVSA